MAIAAQINPQILIWARERQGLRTADVARRSGFKKLDLWECGKDRPTMNQLRSLAHFYKRPSALFYMKEPPEDDTKIADFRSEKDKNEFPLSSETFAEIRTCVSKRDSALELADLLDEPVTATLPKLSPYTDVDKKAEELRTVLNVDIQDIKNLHDDKAVLHYWIKKLESQNILIFSSHTLNGWNPSFREIRGTSRYFREYPWILLNSQEHPRGQLFTMGHELAHLFLRSHAVCSLNEEETNLHIEEERFCNRFSAALLLPAAELIGIVRTSGLNLHFETELDLLIDRIQKGFGVSREAIARRLVSLDFIPWQYYRNIRQRQMEALTKERRAESSGGDGRFYYKRVINWNGFKYTRLVTEAYQTQKISLGEAAGYLHTKVNHVESILRELYG